MDILEKLKKLRKQRGESIPFKSLVEFEKWADEVYPLLKYNEPLAKRFNRARLKAALDLPYGLTKNSIAQINTAVDTVNEAIEELDGLPRSYFGKNSILRAKFSAQFRNHPVIYSIVIGLACFLLGVGMMNFVFS